MNSRQQNRPSPCHLYCKPTNPLIFSSGLIEIHCTYLTITKPTASQKLCLIYKSFVVLWSPLYSCHPCITMNSQHVRKLGAHSKTRKIITFVLFSQCILSDQKLLVQTNAHITLIYDSHHLAATCFGRSPSSVSSKPTQKPTDTHTAAHRSARNLPAHFRVARHNIQDRILLGS
jgi:hypothetical protein